MKIDAIIDDSGPVLTLQAGAPKEVPYAAAVLLTSLSGDVQGGIRKRLPEVFDRPTEFTLRGVFRRPATRAKLEAEVYFPESEEASGRPKREYIRPGAKGASRRNQKRTEYLLTRIGALPQGWVTTPGKGATLNAEGNIAGAVYRRIINVLQIRLNNLKPVSARSQKQAQRLGVDAVFFVVKPGANKLGKGGGWLPPGVWQHLPGRRIAQILKFVKRASYRPRLNLKQEAGTVVRAQLLPRWREASDLISRKFAEGGGRKR